MQHQGNLQSGARFASTFKVLLHSHDAQALEAVAQMHLPHALVVFPIARSVQAVEVVAERVRAHDVRALVVDPVLVSTSGHSLAESDVGAALIKHLFPLATVITPNLPEASGLLGGKKVGPPCYSTHVVFPISKMRPVFQV